MHLNWNLDWSYIDTLSSGYKEPLHKNLQYEYLSVVLCDWSNFFVYRFKGNIQFYFFKNLDSENLYDKWCAMLTKNVSTTIIILGLGQKKQLLSENEQKQHEKSWLHW